MQTSLKLKVLKLHAVDLPLRWMVLKPAACPY